MTRLLRGATAAATMRPAAATVSSDTRTTEATKTTRGSPSIGRRRSTPLLRPSTPSRGQLAAARASEQPHNSVLDSALARIEKLEAENRKLREMLLKGGDGASAASAADDALAPAAAAPAAPAAAPAAPAAAAAAPLPTTLQFQAAEEPTAASASSPLSSIDASNVAWPEPGERFWERKKTPKTKKASAASACSSPPHSASGNSDAAIFHIAAELAPSAKCGGLGDVVRGLAFEVARRGTRSVVVLPFYECLPEDAVEGLELVDEFPCPKGKAGDGGGIASVEQLGVKAFSGTLDGVEVLLLRPDWSRSNLFRGGKIYGGSYNEAEAYLFFCRAALEALSRLVGRGAYPRPSVLHVHDWQACAAAMLYWHLYAAPGSGSPLAREPFAKVLLTIHNFDSSGECRQDEFAATGVDGAAFATIDRALDERTIGHNPERLNLLKGGIVYSNAVTTVSPSYCAEALTGGAAGFLRGTVARPDVAAKFSGVLNGIDEDLWDPATDPSLPANYDAESFREGKKICKEFVQRGLGLAVDPSAPLVICVTRLVPQKGLHLIKRALIHTCRDLGGQFVLLGTGHADGDFKGLNETDEFGPASKSARILLLYSEDLAHQLYGAADAVIVPSLFEPCGLTQLVGLKYGAVPIVRSTGGLADTVFDADRDADRAAREGREVNGFSFGDASEGAVDDALNRALSWYRGEGGEGEGGEGEGGEGRGYGKGPSERFLRLVESGMRQDWSWASAADAYLRIYNSKG